MTMWCDAADIAGLSPFAFSIILGTVAVFPLMFIPSFKKLSWLSLLGCISTVVVTVTVVAAVAMDPVREKMPQQVRISLPATIPRCIACLELIRLLQIHVVCCEL